MTPDDCVSTDTHRHTPTHIRIGMRRDPRRPVPDRDSAVLAGPPDPTDRRFGTQRGGSLPYGWSCLRDRAQLQQLAPLIATVESLGFLTGDDIEPIVGFLHTAPKLARLKSISRLVDEDPFMLSVGTSWSAIAITDFVNVIYEHLNLAPLLDATGVYLGVIDLERDEDAEDAEGFFFVDTGPAEYTHHGIGSSASAHSS